MTKNCYSNAGLREGGSTEELRQIVFEMALFTLGSYSRSVVSKTQQTHIERANFSRMST